MKAFSGGIPYAVDVKMLLEAFPVDTLTEGTVVKHETLEATISSKAKTQRYYGVVNSWIAKLRNQHAVNAVWVPGIGIKVLDPALLMRHNVSRFRHKLRQTGKAANRFRWVDRNRLDEAGKSAFDHVTRNTGMLLIALREADKGTAIELTPIQSLPKPKRDRNEGEGA